MKKVLLVERNLGRKKQILIKNHPFYLKTTPLGLEDFKEDDKSITYRRGNKVWYKAHLEAKPELISINGWAIWYYNEFLTDVDYEGEPCRIFFNPISGKFIANKIVYDEQGRVLLENPAYDEAKTKRILEIFNNGKTPDNQIKITASFIIKGINKLVEGYPFEIRELKKKPEPKAKGRPKEQYLSDAVYWTIVNEKSKKNRNELRSQLYERAYIAFEKQATSKIAFIGAMYRWNRKVRQAWTIEKKKLDLKPHSTLRKFAKKILEVSKNADK